MTQTAALNALALLAVLPHGVEEFGHRPPRPVLLSPPGCPRKSRGSSARALQSWRTSACPAVVREWSSATNS
jgi:hypothetical protein